LGGKLTTTAAEKILRKLNVWRMRRLAGSQKQATGGGIVTDGTNARGTDAVAIGTATATATTATATVSNTHHMRARVVIDQVTIDALGLTE
jgi:hypothetical protein